MPVEVPAAGKKVIEAHLAAVTSRDLETYLSTVHPEVTVIITSGATLRGKDEVAEFHRSWFADPAWVYQPKLIRTAAASGVVTATVEVTYRSEPDTEPTIFLMGLIFVQAGGEWLLFHDQCTILRTA